jgi:hypothetical protein
MTAGGLAAYFSRKKITSNFNALWFYDFHRSQESLE